VETEQGSSAPFNEYKDGSYVWVIFQVYYQLSLYTDSINAYEAFINTGRKDINAINNILGIDKAVNSANASRNLNVQAPAEQGRTG
jgi:hypothetical protein